MNQDPNRDAAWVSVETPFPAPWLRRFVADLERLYRINSLLEIRRWNDKGQGRVRLEALNLSNGKLLETDLRVERLDDGLRLDFKHSLKTSTRLRC